MENGVRRRKDDFCAVAALTWIFCLLFSANRRVQAQKEAAGFDLLVKNGTIVTMDADRHVFEDGVVAVQGDAIAFAGKSSDFVLHYTKGVMAKQTVDAKGKLVLPGFVNGHTNVPMTLLRGVKDD